MELLKAQSSSKKDSVSKTKEKKMGSSTECAAVKFAMPMAWDVFDTQNLDDLDDTQLKAVFLTEPEVFEECVGENELEEDPRYAPDWKGWAMESVQYKNLFVWKYTKDKHGVYCINESQYAAVCCLDATAFADDIESLIAFAEDFGFLPDVEADAAVKQTAQKRINMKTIKHPDFPEMELVCLQDIPESKWLHALVFHPCSSTDVLHLRPDLDGNIWKVYDMGMIVSWGPDPDFADLYPEYTRVNFVLGGVLGDGARGKKPDGGMFTLHYASNNLWTPRKK